MDIVAAALILLIGACTPSTLRPAQVALTESEKGDSGVIDDFRALTFQKSLDSAVAEAKANPQNAQAILEKMGHEYEQVSALCIRHERNSQLRLITKIYLESQKGVLDLMISDAAKANASAKAKGR